MPNFTYLATDSKNKVLKGILEAADISEVKQKLKQKGLLVVRIKKAGLSLGEITFERISGQDLAVFSHQFSVMISSGIPLIRALRAISEEAVNKKLRSVIDKIRFDVENGASLSAAFSKHPKVFSNFFVSLIKSGEASGTLPHVLDRVAGHLEKEEELKRKIASSFAYPAIVAFVALGVVTFLLIFIVPIFAKVYKTLRIDLPGPTLLLVTLSNFFVKFWWLILLLIGLLVYIYIMTRRNAKLGFFWDAWKLKLPVFGQISSKVAVSRFVHNLSTMLGSGVTLSQSLVITKEVVGNRVVANIMDSVYNDINKGMHLSEYLKARKFFPPTVVQMISAGEESGHLGKMMDKCAEFLDENIDALIKSLIVKIEPMLTFLLAAVVGFIALSIYLPMFDLIKHISG